MIGYVPQKLFFDPDTPVSVRDFFAASISRRPVWSGVHRRLRRQIRTLLGYVSAGDLRDRRLGELSGGELQRVLLAMAMTPAPDLLLLDEPATGVDVQGLQLFYQMVESVKLRHAISILMVTHDLAGVAELADRLVLINRKVVAEGKPREVLADRQMMQAFGPGIWNISRLPFGTGPEMVPGSGGEPGPGSGKKTVPGSGAP